MTGNNRRRIVIQERDRHLLRELEILRVVDREQVKIVAGFNSTTRANVRLLSLTRAGLLRRFFLGTTEGGRKALYALSSKAATLLGVPYRGPRRRADEALVADFFVLHQLAINGIYCELKYRTIPVPGVTFQRWLSFYQPLNATDRLIPDGYFELDTLSGALTAFLEVDLGHESLRVWKEKVSGYLHFALSGDFEHRFGQSRFRVLVVANSERRLLSIRKTIAAATGKLFWLTSLESINRDGLFAPVWLRPTGDERQSLA